MNGASMGNNYEINQANDVRPPRVGQIVALTVDATSRGYDLTKLQWNGVPANKLGVQDEFYISFESDSNDVFLAFDSAAPATNSIDDTAAIAAGTPLSLVASGANCPPAKIVAGMPPQDVRIVRSVDKTLIVKCASGKTSVLRFWPSSKPNPGVL